MKIDKKTLILTSLVCLIPLIAGALVYSRLPETVATHFSFDGTPNGWSSRAVAAFGLPGFMLIMNFLLIFGLNADPKRQNMNSALKTIAIWTVPVLSLVCSGITLAGALGYPMKIQIILPVLMGVLFILIGNYLPKTKQSYTMGIRLPWTLNSEENWNRTHRLAGYLWVIGGIAFIVLSFIGWSLAAFLLIIGVMTLVPIVYSYLLYRKEEKML
jgi:uncharacterized membrane protein